MAIATSRRGDEIAVPRPRAVPRLLPQHLDVPAKNGIGHDDCSRWIALHNTGDYRHVTNRTRRAFGVIAGQLHADRSGTGQVLPGRTGCIAEPGPGKNQWNERELGEGAKAAG